MSDVSPTVPQLNPVDVFCALGSEVRWKIIEMLADGKALTASEVAAVLGRDFDGVSKQLRTMRECGVLASRAGEDRRHTRYYLPEEFRREPGALDFGVCWVPLAAVRPPVVKD